MRRALQRERRVLERALARWRGPTLSNDLVKRHRARPKSFDPDQLAIGTSVELEHTDRPELALEIAMAHLLERKDYYALLERLERTPRRTPAPASRRRDPTSRQRAQTAVDHARKDKTRDAWLIAADAAEEAGDHDDAAWMRLVDPGRENELREVVYQGALEGLWLNAWADAQQEAGFRPPSRITLETADWPPPSAENLAVEFVSRLRDLNGSIAEMVARAAAADGVRVQRLTRGAKDPFDTFVEKYGAHLGYSLAMSAQGHGVSWEDDHKAFDVTVPYVEVYATRYERRRGQPVVKWALNGYVSPSSGKRGPSVSRDCGCPHRRSSTRNTHRRR